MMNFNKTLKVLNTLAVIILLTMAFAVNAKADTELLFELDQIMDEDSREFTECILDKTGVCNVDTSDVEKHYVKEETPEVFKDSKIVRTTKDGKTVELDGDKFKIVPRNQNRIKVVKSKKKIKPVVIRTEYVDRDISKKNTISLVVGITPTKLKVKEATGSYRAETDEEFDMGLMYQRRFGKKQRYSIGGQIHMQGSAYLNGGLNF